MTPLVRHRSAAPLHQFGLWALLRTVVDDRGAEARETLRGLPAAARLANRAALDYADAVAAGRAGQADKAAALVAAAEDALTPLPWLRRTLRLLALESSVTEGWGDPVPLLRASLAEHEAHAEEVGRPDGARPAAPGRCAHPPRPRGLRRTPAAGRPRRDATRAGGARRSWREAATNAQIAERLFLSKRTVETHVSNLLLKTGATSRDELARFSE